MSRRVDELPGQVGGREQTFSGVQLLRGLAACMVVVYHATSLWWIDFGHGARPAIWEQGASGVDLFFVISGFVMMLANFGERTPSASTFLKRRVIRIAPLYWLFTLLVIVKIALVQLRPGLGSDVEHLPISFASVSASLLFIPYRNARNMIQPVLAAGWTLTFEMFFYLIFALALWFRVRPLRLLTPVLAVLAFVGLFHRESWPALMVVFDPILLEFLGGAALGYAVRKGMRMQAQVCWPVALSGLVGLFFVKPGSFSGSRVLVWGVSAFCVVLAAVMLERSFAKFLPRFLLRVGDASYSLYLAHSLVISAVARVMLRVGGRAISETAMVLLCVVLSVAVSLAVHVWIEKPMTAALLRGAVLRKPVMVES